MLLSSLDRVRIFISTVESGARTELVDGVGNDGDLLGWLDSVSAQIELYLGRTIESTSYTEYFKSSKTKLQYFVKAWPVTTLTSVFEDSTGEWNGSQSEISNSYIGEDENCICLEQAIGHQVAKGVRMIYTGGMAAHGVRSIFAISSVTGTWTVNKYVQGQTSKAMGLVVSATASAITIANLYGTFLVGETLQEQDSEGTQGGSDGTAVIDSITSQSLAEKYPDIARACEMQVRYLWKHKLDLENNTTSPEGTVRRHAAPAEGQLQPEVQELLRRYRRMVIA